MQCPHRAADLHPKAWHLPPSSPAQACLHRPRRTPTYAHGSTASLRRSTTTARARRAPNCPTIHMGGSSGTTSGMMSETAAARAALTTSRLATGLMAALAVVVVAGSMPASEPTTGVGWAGAAASKTMTHIRPTATTGAAPTTT
eukprot:361895-Chlamydomonas_euryale.AAC.2